MKRNFAFTAATLVLAFALGACAGAGDEPVLLGLAGPVSQANGRSMHLAAEMAVDEVNRSSRGCGGRKVDLAVKDDEASPEKAITVAQQLRRDDRVVAVIGHLNSAASLKAAPIYNAEKGANDSIPGEPLLQISPASSAPALTGAGRWTFRVTPTDLEFSPELARWAGQLGLRRAAVVYVNDDYGQGVRRTFEEAFQQQGGEVVAADPYLPAVLQRGDELDPYLIRSLQRGRADALVIGGQADAGFKIISAARRLGYTGHILGADGLTNVKDMGPLANGVFISSAFLPDQPDTAAQRFVEDYRKRYGNELPDHRGAMAYDVVYLLCSALEAVGTDRAALRDWVAGRTTDDRAHRGVSGTIVFDTAGDVKGKRVNIGVVRDGELVTAGR